MTVIRDGVLTLVMALAPDPVSEPDVDLEFVDDLGYTSLRFLELCIAVERAFALPPLDQEALSGVRTVNDLVGIVRTHKDGS